MKTNNYKREALSLSLSLSLLNKYKAYVLVLIATLGIALLGCENKAAAGAEQEYYRLYISAGEYYTVVIDSDGTLWSWGKNDKGQLGDGTTANKSTPVRVQQAGETAETFIDNTTKWKAVATGNSHTVGIAEDGTLWSWGQNAIGQLGDGTTAHKSIPVRVQQKTEAETFVDNTTKWKAVSTGDSFTVGIDSDGTLWSWGWNGKGQLGDGTNTDRTTPVRVQQKTEAGVFVDNRTKWKAVVAGKAYTVGIDINGTLWSWGQNGKGQLGDGTKIAKSIPVRVQKETEAGVFVDNTTKWKAVAAGYSYTVGIDSDGTLWSWGKNYEGQLGDGTKGVTTNKSIPVRVQQKTTEAGPLADNTTKWKAVSAGGSRTVGIAEDGSLWLWGENGKSTPVRVQQAGITWEAVSAGEEHTVAIGSDGSLWPGATPGRVWKAVSAGGFHTVGIDIDGTLWSWGWNSSGQLGDGTTTKRNTPVKIQIPK